MQFFYHRLLLWLFSLLLLRHLPPAAAGRACNTSSLLTESILPPGDAGSYERSEFGYDLVISSDGSTGVIGAYRYGDRTGIVHVYDISEDGVTLSQIINAPTNASNQEFGKYVALSADGARMVVGAPFTDDLDGAVHAYDRDGAGTFNLMETLPLPPNATGDLSEFGSAVALSADGSRLLVGAPLASMNAGKVYAYDYSGSSFELVETLSSPAPLEFFGRAVAMSADGTRLLIGAPATNDASSAGSAYFIDRTSTGSGDTFSIVANVLPESPPCAYCDFGHSVAFDSEGTRAVIGGPGLLSDVGEAYVFDRSDENVQLAGVLNFSGSSRKRSARRGSTGPLFGRSVALSRDGSKVLVGAPGDSTGTSPAANIGSVYAYETNEPVGEDVTFSLVEIVRPQNVTNSSSFFFGNRVAMSSDGSIVLIGADEGDTLAADAGEAFVYTGTFCIPESSSSSDEDIDGNGAVAMSSWADWLLGPSVLRLPSLF